MSEILKNTPYLIFQNWKMLYRIKGFEIEKLQISRLLLSVLLIILIFFIVNFKNYFSHIFSGMVVSLFLLELLRLNKKCLYDIINFSFAEIKLRKLVLALFFVELLSPKIIALIFLLAIKENDYNILMGFTLLYVFVVYIQVIFGLIGLRSKLFSQIYLWFIFILIGFSFGLLNIFGENSESSILENYLTSFFQSSVENNKIISLGFIFIIISLSLTQIAFVKQINLNPFPDPESFPKKIF